jgi:glycine dehydrogenase subunit 1
MTYFPHTDADRKAMLDAIGVAALEDLFGDVPATARFPDLELPTPCTEMEIGREMRRLAHRNDDPDRRECFLGAGTYNHYSPATVDYVLQRGEFYTSYTPYQPEMSQGMLQAMFEYQSMICRLTGMEVSNASHYDGATALAEGVLLALNAAERKRNRIILSPGVNSQYSEVVRTYLRGTDAEIVGDAEPDMRFEDLEKYIDDRTAALVIQNPNFFGQFEEVDGLASAVHGARLRWACFSHQGPMGRISSSPRASHWAFHLLSVGRISASSRPTRPTFAVWPAGWSARRSTQRTSAAMC